MSTPVVSHRVIMRRVAAAASCAIALAAAPVGVRAQGGAIPTPESVFGFPVGADYKLFDYEESIGYFRRLEAASDHIRLIEVGRTSFGKPWTVAIISSPENLGRLEELRQINMRLAHPQGLSDDEARHLASEGRVIVDISGGLHASETAGAQHTPLLAYDLLSTADEPATREILDNVIFFLWPTINPDGQDIVVNWCRDRDAGRNPPPMELYQKHIGHDNNRDAYMLNVVESRVVQRTWREWEPGIIYVHHQSSPFPTRIWIPPFADPVGVNAPPIPARTINTIGMTIAQELEANGQPGATHMLATFDAWYPGYVDYMPVYQNIPAWWTETQGGNCATPRTTTLDSLPPDYRDLRPTPLYLSPWAEGTWTLRDAVDYMVTASKATLRYAARNREDLLYNRYQSGRNVIRKYGTSAPYAFLVPQAQHDRMAPVELLRRLAFMGVRISQTDRELTHDGRAYPAGTWVIPMDQEYAELVRELFAVQDYPDLPEGRPYDAAGWTLPFQMNVDVVAARTPLSTEFRAALRPVRGTAVDWTTAADAPFETNAVAAGIVPLPGRVSGSGDRLALDPAQNNSFRLINRALEAGGGLQFQPAGGERGGRYIVSGVPMDRLTSWASELSVTAERTTARATSSAVAAPKRIGLYKGAPGNMDQGWTEWLFDSYGFDYELVTPADVVAGGLGDRFDVVVLASQTLGVVAGGRRGAPVDSAAAAAARTEAAAVVKGMDDFVRGGGTTVVWGRGAGSVIDALRLPVRDVVQGLSRNDYFTGISLMRVTTDPVHPVMAGMPAQADVVVGSSPVFTTMDGFDGVVLASYAKEGSPLRSGWLNGAERMQGGAAAVDVRHGDGHVVLVAFQPQWRGQPTGTFRVVFNSLFFAGDVAGRAKGTPGFWAAP
ncbi:MAG: M14 family metallopeptidase [Gemmatimonadaceae bacterium]